MNLQLQYRRHYLLLEARQAISILSQPCFITKYLFIEKSSEEQRKVK